MAGVSSQGTTFSFGGAVYDVTSIQVNFGQQRRSVAGGHMGLSPNDFEPLYLLHRTEEERATVDIEFIGGGVPQINAPGSISIGGKIAFAANAICVSSQVTLSVGDIVRGTASFRVA